MPLDDLRTYQYYCELCTTLVSHCRYLLDITLTFRSLALQYTAATSASTAQWQTYEIVPLSSTIPGPSSIPLDDLLDAIGAGRTTSRRHTVAASLGIILERMTLPSEQLHEITDGPCSG